MGPPYEATPRATVGPDPSQGRAGGGAGRARSQNLMPPIMPAMFVVSSLIVGAMVDEAR